MLTKGRAYFVDAGERLRLGCQFFMETFNLFDNPVVWIKTQLDERTQMNMMGNLVEPFESTRRFRVTFEAQRPTFTFGLLIEGRLTAINDPRDLSCLSPFASIDCVLSSGRIVNSCHFGHYKKEKK